MKTGLSILKAGPSLLTLLLFGKSGGKFSHATQNCSALGLPFLDKMWIQTQLFLNTEPDPTKTFGSLL